jgi:hypothetical protein
MQLPEKYKENFDVSNEGLSFETLKFSLYGVVESLPIQNFLIIATPYTHTVQHSNL